MCLFAVRNEPVDWTKWLMRKKEEIIQGLKSLRREPRLAFIVKGWSDKRAGALHCCWKKSQHTDAHGCVG